MVQSLLSTLADAVEPTKMLGRRCETATQSLLFDLAEVTRTTKTLVMMGHRFRAICSSFIFASTDCPILGMERGRLG